MSSTAFGWRCAEGRRGAFGTKDELSVMPGESANGGSADRVRDILHLVAAPSCALVRAVVVENLRSADRLRWYPSVLLEGYEDDPEQRALADTARRLGVPVVTTRSRRGSRGVDNMWTFVDDWFFVRNTYASLVHVHSTRTGMRRSPARWLSPVIRKTWLVESIYPLDGAGDSSDVALEVKRAGRRRARRTVAVRDMRDANWLYDALLKTHRSR
jgi:hypothetical protein